MSNLYQEWSALSIKIKSLINVTEFFFTSQGNSSDSHGSVNSLSEEAKKNVSLFIDFKNNFTHVLSDKILNEINEFIKYHGSFNKLGGDPEQKKKATIKLIMNLALVESIMTPAI